jgi:hypothetical protein
MCRRRARLWQTLALALLLASNDASAVTWQQICSSSKEFLEPVWPAPEAIAQYQRTLAEAPPSKVPQVIQDYNAAINFNEFAPNTQITTQYKADLDITFAACHGFGATCKPTQPFITVRPNAYNANNQGLTAQSNAGDFGELISLSGTFNTSATAKRISLNIGVFGTFSFASIFFLDKSGKILKQVMLKAGWNEPVLFPGTGAVGSVAAARVQEIDLLRRQLHAAGKLRELNEG